jgi:hypothetical protein
LGGRAFLSVIEFIRISRSVVQGGVRQSLDPTFELRVARRRRDGRGSGLSFGLFGEFHPRARQKQRE